MTAPKACTLTAYEMQWAAELGIRRTIEAIRQGRPETEGKPKTDWNHVINGACAEIAVAKYLNIPWQAAINNYRKGGDVGGFEVRHTEYPKGKLRVDPRASDATYILVTGNAPYMVIAGYMPAAEAKKIPATVLTEGRQAMHWVTQDKLMPMESLTPREFNGG